MIAGAVNHFAVSGPASAVTGSPASFTVAAEDSFNNVISTYHGTVHFSSTDAAATLPSNATLTSGSGVFSAVFQTSGNQTLTATDASNSGLTGTSAAIAVRGLDVTSFTVTPWGFVATFSKPIQTFNVAANQPQINLYDSATASYGTADVTLTSTSTNVRGSLLIDPTGKTVTFIRTDAGSASAGLLASATAAITYTATFRSASNGFEDLSGNLLDGNGDGVAGDNYVNVFTVPPVTNLVISLPDCARGPGNSVVLPNQGGTGIPITLSNPGTSAVNVTDATFNLTYNPALLNIVAPSTIAGSSGTFTMTANTGGVATFVFHSGTAVNIPAGGTFTLGQIVAVVPNSASSLYLSKELLDISSIVVSNSGSGVTTTASDAVHVNAYLGDVAGTGAYIPLDATLISRVAVAFDSGFASYPLLDPSIIGDINANGQADSADVSLMNKYLAGLSVPQLPTVPTGLIITPAGPDPTLSIPTDLPASQGGTVIVPVNIDTAQPAGSNGLTNAVLALTFDPQVFEVSADDVELGTVLNSGTGWQLRTVVNDQTGEIGIDLYSITPIQTTAGGSLVTITLHVRDTAPAGATGLSLVSQVNPTGGRLYRTEAADQQGGLVLSPAPTATGITGDVIVGGDFGAGDQGAASVFQATFVSHAPASVSLGVQQTEVQGNGIAAVNGLALGLVEQVFGELEQTAMAVQENLLGQPGPLLNAEEGDLTTSGTRELGVLAQSALPNGQWDDCLEQLAQTSLHKRGGLLDNAAALEGADLAGLEAFFAREAA